MNFPRQNANRILINLSLFFQQVSMAHTYHSDSFSAIHGSSSYHPSNGTTQAKMNDKSMSKEYHKDMIVKHITSQLNASINGNPGYEYYPNAPHDFYNHSLSNTTKFGYNDFSGK